MRIWRFKRWINLVQTGRWNTKRKDSRYTSKKRSRPDTQKAIYVCRADGTTNHEMKIIKQEIEVDAVQRNRRSNNDNRGKIKYTA